MRQLTLVGTVLAGLTLVAAGASAQNSLPFTGAEAGAQIGGGFGSASGDFAFKGGGGGGGGGGELADPHYSLSPSGFLGGLHGGYDYEFYNHVVLGAEGTLEGSTVEGSVTNNNYPYSVKEDMRYAGSVRGRLGYAFDRVMLYGNGGFAFGDVTMDYKTPTSYAHFYGLRTGWTAGGGVAYKLTRHWETNVEYSYTDFGHHSYALNIFRDNNEFNYSAIKVGLTYRFTPPPPPPPMAAPMPAAAPAPAPPPPPRTFLVFFDFDRYNLTPEARRTLDAAAFTYKKSGIARIEVSGYTDLAGTQAYNLRLSRRRADAVAAYLSGLGVPRRVMDVRWFGKEHPRVPTPDGVREPQNRRVEIMMP
jgi:outer membrane protein OmpA-like peptidoglycan-associated protein